MPLWGKEDRVLLVHRDARSLGRLLPGVDLVALPDAGHFAPLERPGAWARQLLEWGETSRSRG